MLVFLKFNIVAFFISLFTESNVIFFFHQYPFISASSLLHRVWCCLHFCNSFMIDFQLLFNRKFKISWEYSNILSEIQVFFDCHLSVYMRCLWTHSIELIILFSFRVLTFVEAYLLLSPPQFILFLTLRISQAFWWALHWWITNYCCP